ncbi:MAG: pyridoxal 5'-phosphate synthase glutaminase subunit PdxT [Actinomycetes bacterium]
MTDLRVGVLALQGDFALHARLVTALGHSVSEVRTPVDMRGIDALILPGGESTTISMGIEREGLAEPIRAMHSAGAPIFGTCAGMVLLGRGHLGLIDAAVERNAFGRQVHSFEADLVVSGVAGDPIRALFIRAPAVTDLGPGVQVLAEVDGRPVAIREGNVTAISFHPELIGEGRLHSLALGESAPTDDAPAAAQSLS